MRTITLLSAILVSGALAGLIYGLVNYAIVEPYLDQSIMIENQGLFASGQAADTPEFWVEYGGYRDWQKGGQILAGVVLGASFGSLFGIVYTLSRRSLPGRSEIRRTLALAGIMFGALYLVPFLKYPAYPPATGDPETVALRSILYLSLIAISGISALLFYMMSRRLGGMRRIVPVAGYAAFMSAVVILMPGDDTDSSALSDAFLAEFRMMTLISAASFWASIGVLLGFFWRRFELHNEYRPAHSHSESP